MPEFKIDPMPTRKLNSDRVVYYVYSTRTKQLVTKFNTDVEKAEDIEEFETLTSAEQLELQNYIDNIRFFIDLGLAAKINRDHRFLLPEPLQKEALPKLAERAKAHNIPFQPMKAALNGFLNHIKTTVKRIKEYEDCSILEEIGINSENEFQAAKETKEKETKKYSKKIFKALLAVPNYLEKYAAVAKKFFHKETNLNTTTIINYSVGKAKPSLWSISCALMVLGQNNVSIFENIPYPVAIPLWLEPLKFSGMIRNKKKASTVFADIFHLKATENKRAAEIINSLYKD